MKIVRAVLRGIDWTNTKVVAACSWLVLVIAALLTYEVILRYVFNSPTAWSYDISYMVGGSFMIIGVGYVLKLQRHVRVDILFNRFSDRVKAGVDTVFTLFLFFPLVYVLLKFSIAKAIHGWEIGEKGGVGYWMPPLSPFRTLLCVAIALLALQGIAWFMRSAYKLIRGEDL